VAKSEGLANLWACLAADVHGGGVFFAAAGGLAHRRAWLAADGHEGNVYFFAAAGGARPPQGLARR
jgi:hypothetical protein